MLGNPQLEPEKTEALEISHQKAVGSKSVLGTTFFVKKVENLLNTINYYSDGDQLTSYARFKNLDRAAIKGFEIFFEQIPGKNNFFGKLSYTYCKATGTGSFPLENYYSVAHISVSNLDVIRDPLTWDQRHKLSFNISYLNHRKIEVDLIDRINNPLPLLDVRLR